MQENYMITNTDNYMGDLSMQKHDQELMKMVDKFPEMFENKKWDKYRKTETKEIVDAREKFGEIKLEYAKSCYEAD